MSPTTSTRPEILVRYVRSRAYTRPVLARQARTLLDARERDMLSRLRSAAARRDYLAAHALLRTMLAEHCAMPPARLPLRANAKGRPELLASGRAARLHFSPAHADGIALCALSTGSPIGADVESLRNLGPAPWAVAATLCSASELASLHGLPPPAQAERLLTLWTIKEAIAKSLGLGFHMPLQQLTVYDAAGAPVDVEPAPDTPCWRVVSLRLSAHHIASIAALTTPPEACTARFEEVRPLAGTAPLNGMPLRYVHTAICLAGLGRRLCWPTAWPSFAE